jgi:hypothetical protein
MSDRVHSFLCGCFLTHKSPGVRLLLPNTKTALPPISFVNFDLRAHKGTPITVFFVLIEDFQLVDPILII